VIPAPERPLLLMTPGPTRVPDRVRAAGAREAIHHRTEAFAQVLAQALAGLRPLFCSDRADVLPVHAPGRGALEASVVNLFSPGDQVIACSNGKFGGLWADIAAAHGLGVHRVCSDWERAADPEEIDRAFAVHPRARALLLAHCDSSSGVLNDVAAVAAVARARGALVLVDAVSALGGVPFEFDSWEVDLAVTASQKCLMSSPGLSFVAVGARAWTAYAQARLPRVYWDFGAIRDTLARPRPETPGTTPVSLMREVAEALVAIAEEGLPAVFARHRDLARQTREGVAALGLPPLSPALAPLSPTLTAVALPGLDPGRLRQALVRRGVLVAEGLGPSRGRGIRIGHLGDIRPADVERTLQALAEALAEVRG
jgi:aspartate aminotransferase-like enzyme